MFSVVCCFNNRRMLADILIPSLRKQNVRYELIAIDNTTNRFPSAALALNYGGNQAHGDYILFVHQDVELASPSWLKDTEQTLKGIPKLGIAGVVGMADEGNSQPERGRGRICDRGEDWPWGKPINSPQKVQTLDECVLMVPKDVFKRMPFDARTFDYWHCYGADHCLTVQEAGLGAYVVPGYVYHRSVSANDHGLLKYQIRLYQKHKDKFPNIYLTTGQLSGLRLLLRTGVAIMRPVSENFFNWTGWLKRELDGCESVLDVGCGYASPLYWCHPKNSTGVELFDPYLEESRKKALHNRYIRADITKLELPPESYDAVFCSEVLEHLTVDEGYRLIKNMKAWAKKKVILTTPNGYLYQDGYDENPLQNHKSGWSVADLKGMGFEVHGMSGFKWLRGYKGGVRYKPELLCEGLSLLSRPVAYALPNTAFQLYAVARK